MATVGETYGFSEEYIENVKLIITGSFDNLVSASVITPLGTESVNFDGGSNYSIYVPLSGNILLTVTLNTGQEINFDSVAYTFSSSITEISFEIPSDLSYDNEYNFVRWVNVESSNFTESDIPNLSLIESDITNENEALEGLIYHPIIAKDEVLRWYFNSQSLVSEPIEDLFLFFIDKNGIRASSNITGVNSDVISGSDYRPYMDLTIPELSNSGSCYRMVVASSSKIILISNVFNYSSNANVYGNKSFVIRYRNNKDMLNFGYENTGLESFYNQIRIKLRKQNPKNDVQDNGYDLVNGRFNRVRTSINKNYNWFTYYMDSFGHDAMNASLVHSDFEIFEFGEYVRYYLGDNSYNQDSFEKEFPLTQADFTLTKGGGSSFKTL